MNNKNHYLINQVAIVGPGLIGASLGLALKKNKICKNIIGIDKSKKNLKDAIENRSIDLGYHKIDSRIRNTDVYFICTPVSQLNKVVEELIPFLKKNSVITDVGSVKNIFKKDLISRVNEIGFLVPAHPIAGTEFSGAKNAILNMFFNRWCIITPVNRKIHGVNLIKSIWQSIGMMVATMSPKEHDKIMSITSHLPHLIAFTIVGSALNYSKKEKRQLLNFSAGGFKDFTRIASSDPKMWRDIFLSNRKDILKTLEMFIKNLNSFKNLIQYEKSNQIMDFIKKTKKIRKEIVKLE
tara:strand:+ start:65 stop:949 length:885 start_codon:yes stop_codon:yes gene_type:complete